MRIVADSFLPLIQNIRSPNKALWQAIINSDTDKLTDDQLAFILSHVNQHDAEDNNARCMPTDNIIANLLVLLNPEVGVKISAYRDRIRSIISPKQPWEFLWKITSEQDIQSLSAEDKVYLLRTIELIPFLVINDDQYSLTVTSEIPAEAVACARYLHLQGLLLLGSLEEVDDYVCVFPMRVQLAATRLDHTLDRKTAINLELQALQPIIDDVAETQRLTGVVDAGPLSRDDLGEANSLVNKAIQQGAIKEATVENRQQLAEALEKVATTTIGAEHLPDEGLTSFLPKRAASNRLTYMILALKTEKGMTQYLAFVKWQRQIRRWQTAGQRRLELLQEFQALDRK